MAGRNLYELVFGAGMRIRVSLGYGRLVVVIAEDRGEPENLIGPDSNRPLGLSIHGWAL